MRSIQFQLTLLFIVATTVVLGGFGFYSHRRLANDLESQFARQRQETATRLSISLPGTVWNNDLTNANAVLASEMLPAEVRAILVREENGELFASAARNASGEVIPLTQEALASGLWEEAQLFWQSGMAGARSRVPIGKVRVLFSREPLEARLQANVRSRAIEILVVDLVLLVVLSVSLRLVFVPLARLRDALLDLSHQQGDVVQELPETQPNEFGRVAQGFNQTLRKLKSVVRRHQQAEASARASARQAELALDDLQAAQKHLLQAQKMAALGSLVAGVAHEINTPVGITVTSASVLAHATDALQQAVAAGQVRKTDVLAYLATAQEASRLILSNSERAALLIQSFKQVAVDQTAEIRRAYALKAYIDEVIASLAPSLKRANARVLVQCPIGIVLDGYPGSLAQVLTNLVMNALTHAFEPGSPGSITIDANLVEERVELVFADDGRGIAAEHLDKIFDPFFTTRRGQGGTGLGLNVVHNIVSAQFGGTIEVSSQLGQGTRFTLRFPRVSPQEPPKNRQET